MLQHRWRCRVGTPESRVTDAGLATLVPHVSALKHLDLSYNWSITDASLALLGASCKVRMQYSQ